MREIIKIILLVIMTAVGSNQRTEADRAPGSDYDIGMQRESWRDAYLDFIQELENGDSYTYALIYVNDDEVPELVADSGFEAGGCKIVTFDGNEADVLQTSRLHFDYVERGNALCNSDGHMGYYYDVVFTIENGKWVRVAEGVYHDPESDPQLDENGNYIFEFEWEGESVDQLKYFDELETVYDRESAVTPGPYAYYIRNEMISYLETGACLSAGHRYELVTDDVTWSEAREICEGKGGYLATITSWEEWNTVTEQIKREGKTGIQFLVGAGARDGDENLIGYCWFEEDGRIDWLTNFKVFYEFWLPGEPSYTMTDENGREIDEDAVVLFFRSADDRFYINDVPDDILSVTPEYSGKIGYICEYND